jgi:hypothetical protein
MIDLVKEHGLSEKIDSGLGTKDRKSGFWKPSIDITAEGGLRNAIDFVKDLYELPYVSRVTSVTMDPISTTRSRGRNRRSGGDSDRVERVSLKATVDILVPPMLSLHGQEVDMDRLTRPESYVSHSGKEFATLILERDPFNEYQPPPPPPQPKTTPRRRPPVREEPPAPPPPTEPVDPQGRSKIVRGVFGNPSLGIIEVYVVDERNGDHEYIPLHEELDGGEVVLAHSHGVVVDKEEWGYKVYEVGKSLEDRLSLEDAAFPGFRDLKRIMEARLETEREGEKTEQEEDATGGQGEEGSREEFGPKTEAEAAKNEAAIPSSKVKTVDQADAKPGAPSNGEAGKNEKASGDEEGGKNEESGLSPREKWRKRMEEIRQKRESRRKDAKEGSKEEESSQKENGDEN